MMMQRLLECCVNPLKGRPNIEARKWLKYMHTQFSESYGKLSRHHWLFWAGRRTWATSKGLDNHRKPTARTAPGPATRESGWHTYREHPLAGGRRWESAGYTIATKRKMIKSNWYSSSGPPFLSRVKQSTACQRIYMEALKPTPTLPSLTH